MTAPDRAARPAAGADTEATDEAFTEWLRTRHADRASRGSFWNDMRTAWWAALKWKAARPAPAAAEGEGVIERLERIIVTRHQGVIGCWACYASGERMGFAHKPNCPLVPVLALARAAAPVVGGGDAGLERWREAVLETERLRAIPRDAGGKAAARDNAYWWALYEEQRAMRIMRLAVVIAARPPPRADTACCPSCGQPRPDAVADRCGYCEPIPRCDECGHPRGDHRGPQGECWFADEGACAWGCGGFKPTPRADAGEGAHHRPVVDADGHELVGDGTP